MFCVLEGRELSHSRPAPLLNTMQATLVALNQQLSAMTWEISLSAPLRNVPERVKSALAKKLEAEETGVEAVQPFRLSAATRRKLTEAGKREHQLIRADLTQFLKTPVPHSRLGRIESPNGHAPSTHVRPG